jgi:uncharacterized protein
MIMSRAYHVIDSDGHILEPLSLWADYMDPALRDRAPRLQRDSHGRERLLIGEKMLGGERGMAALGAVGRRDGTVVVDDARQYADGRKGGFDPHARIPDMDLDGIDAAYLYPSIGLFAGSVEDPKLSAAICRAYNRWLAEYCAPYPERLFGIAMLPMQHVDMAIEEMRFARQELGMPGVFLRPNPYNNKMVHDPSYDRFWSAVEDFDVAGDVTKQIRDADAFCVAVGNTEGCAIASASPVPRGQRPWHVADTFCTGTGRSHDWPAEKGRSASGRLESRSR